jgi:hypothetical protein
VCHTLEEGSAEIQDDEDKLHVTLYEYNGNTEKKGYD